MGTDRIGWAGRRVMAGGAVAALAGAAALVGFTPARAVPADAAPVVAPVAAAARPASLELGQTRTFAHFRVTVSSVYRDDGWYGVRAQTCLRSRPPGFTSTVPVGWAPWTVQTAAGRRLAPVNPEAEGLYPAHRRLRVGECASGWLPFHTGRRSVVAISYANSLGDRASWSPGSHRLGGTARFPHFTVRVTAVHRDDHWFVARARVCLTSRPPGSPGRVPVSWAPWSLVTPDSTVPLRVVQEGAPRWQPTYPAHARLRVGQCVTGWLPFGVGEGTEILALQYRNSLGDQAIWWTR